MASASSPPIEVVPGRVFYMPLGARRAAPGLAPVVMLPPDTATEAYVPVDEFCVYHPFFLDFGPAALNRLYRFCQVLDACLKDKALAGKRIVLVSGTHMHRRANSVYLIAAFCMLYLGRSPEESLWPFAGMSPPIAPWHDASPQVDSFHLTTLDALRGILRAHEHGFFSFADFDLATYEHYEQVASGDMNWLIVGRFLALAGPHDANTAPGLEEGYHLTTAEELLPTFHAFGITLLVRLNKKYYNERRFTAAGIQHADLYFLDGSNPPEHILQSFLKLCEETPGAIAVHCKAGLGRTGSCIGAYMMKHYGFSAREAIGWMRVCRPGSVIGPQQHYLESIQARMWEEGAAFRRTKQLPRPVPGCTLARIQQQRDAQPAATARAAAEGPSDAQARALGLPTEGAMSRRYATSLAASLGLGSGAGRGAASPGGSLAAGDDRDGKSQGDLLLRAKTRGLASPPPGGGGVPL